MVVRGQPGVSPGLGAQVEDDRRPGAVLRQVRQVSQQLGVLLASSRGKWAAPPNSPSGPVRWLRGGSGGDDLCAKCFKSGGCGKLGGVLRSCLMF